MKDLLKYKITRIHIKIDNYNYYYFVNYEYENEKKEIEFVQPLMLCMTDLKRCIRRLERR